MMGGWQTIRRLEPSLVALAVAVGAPTESLVLAGRISATLTVAGVAAGLALLARRRQPMLGPVIAVVVIGLVAPWGDHPFWRSTVLVLAIVVAAWRLGRDNPLRVAAPAALAVAPFQAAYILLAPASAGLNPIAAVAVPVSCWSAGAVIRRRSEVAADLAGRAAAAAGSRAAVAQRAVAEERANIARELHDVVAHTLTVMTLQAGGARMQLDSDPDRAMTAVHAVERAGREALNELRRMVQVLDGDDQLRLEPQPGMASIDHLVEQMEAAGLQLVVTVDGKRPPLGSGLDLACYRVVQEALTNALRHGNGRAALSVRYRADQIEIEVVNECGGCYRQGSGAGLIGISERVSLYGGTVETGSRPDGTYHIRACLPVGAT